MNPHQLHNRQWAAERDALRGLRAKWAVIPCKSVTVIPLGSFAFWHCYPVIKYLKGRLVLSEGGLWHKVILNCGCQLLRH